MQAPDDLQLGEVVVIAVVPLADEDHALFGQRGDDLLHG